MMPEKYIRVQCRVCGTEEARYGYCGAHRETGKAAVQKKRKAAYHQRTKPIREDKTNGR